MEQDEGVAEAGGAVGVVEAGGAAGVAATGAVDIEEIDPPPQALKPANARVQAAAGNHRRVRVIGIFVRCMDVPPCKPTVVRVSTHPRGRGYLGRLTRRREYFDASRPRLLRERILISDRRSCPYIHGPVWVYSVCMIARKGRRGEQGGLAANRRSFAVVWCLSGLFALWSQVVGTQSPRWAYGKDL